MAETRWERLKTYLFYGAIFVFLIGPILVGGIGPIMARSYIDRENPAGQPVKPWATKWMYYLGRAYSLRLNDNKAKDIYGEVFEVWYEDPDREIKDDDPYLGLCIVEYANILWERRRRQSALPLLEFFVEHWRDNPGVPPETVRLAEAKIQIWHVGAVRSDSEE